MPDFSQAKHVVLASYPRSGNTLVRTILFQCFGLHSASMYPEDFGGNAAAERYIGHVSPDANGELHWPNEDQPRFVKRHDLLNHAGPTIYILRNGREAIKSMHRFYPDSSADSLIRGQNIFGTWSNHVRYWFARENGQTLLLRYEQLIDELPLVLTMLSRTLQRPILNPTLPSRDEIASENSRWVRPADDRPTDLTAAEEQLFQQVNGEAMRMLGYR